MNTTAKGDAFEKKSLDIIKDMIENKRIAVMADAYTVHEKRSYYSHDRKGNIIFDLVIEVKPPGADKISLIYIIECKDYRTPVSIDRLEAFCSKIEQVAPRNSKAIFITSSRFQKSAYNYADSKGIMLVGVDHTNNYNIILYKNNCLTNTIPFLNKNKPALDQGESYLEKDIDQVITNYINQSSLIRNTVAQYSKQDIEDITNEVLNEIDKDILEEGEKLTSRQLVDYTNKTLGLIVKNTDNKAILGCFNSINNTIQVNHELNKSKRYKFILAHEIGHAVIHDGNIVDSTIMNIMPDPEYNFDTNRYNLANEINWVEWQANYFAVCLTMPKAPVIARLYYFQQRYNLREGKLYVDDQISNIKDFIKVINAMSLYFDLSKTAIINRLKELDMMTDKSRTKSIGMIMHEYREHLII